MRSKAADHVGRTGVPWLFAARLGTSDLTSTWAKAMMVNRYGLGEEVANLTSIISDAG